MPEVREGGARVHSGGVQDQDQGRRRLGRGGLLHRSRWRRRRADCQEGASLRAPVGRVLQPLVPETARLPGLSRYCLRLSCLVEFSSRTRTPGSEISILPGVEEPLKPESGDRNFVYIQFSNWAPVETNVGKSVAVGPKLEFS